MNLSRKQFDVLESLATGQRRLSVDDLEKLTGHNSYLIMQIINELSDYGFIKDSFISDAGFNVLEPYRSRRAIFLAAGFGSRLVPVTLNTPKPLVRVHGVRIIDRLIDACLAVGIEEIYIVRGYLAEQFDQLLYKYPMIKFIENPIYNEANNISSAMIARDLMQNAYVLESDLLLTNPNIIKKYHYQSDVLGIWKDRTDDWCFEEKDGYVVAEKIGGLNCWQMVGIYYFNSTDGARLSGHLNQAYKQPGGKERYWETVPNQVFQGQYKIEIIPCTDEDIVEIDTFNELKAIDKTYDV